MERMAWHLLFSFLDLLGLCHEICIPLEEYPPLTRTWFAVELSGKYGECKQRDLIRICCYLDPTLRHNGWCQCFAALSHTACGPVAHEHDKCMFELISRIIVSSLLWRHNGRGNVSNHQPPRLLTQTFRAQITENIKVTRHWPLCGEFTGDRWIPRTKGQ